MKRDRASGEALDHHASASKLGARLTFFGLELSGCGLAISLRAALKLKFRTRAEFSSSRCRASFMYRSAVSALRSHDFSHFNQSPCLTCALARIRASPAAIAFSRKF